MSPMHLAGLTLAFLAVALGAYAALRLFWPMLEKRITSAEEDNVDKLRDLFMPSESARALAYLQYFGPAALGVAVYWASASFVFAAGSVVAGILAHRVVFKTLKTRRKKKINDQLPDALNIMASGSRAGMNLGQVIRQVAETGLPPIREEFGLIVSAMELGGSVEEALTRSRARLGLPNFDLVVTSILINRDKGGDLTTLLKRIADSIREIDRLEKKVESETASMRFSAKMMAAMPVIFFCILYAMDPESMGSLFNTIVGNFLLVAVVVLTVIGYTMIQKLANPDI